MVHDRTLAADARYSRGLLRCYADDFRLGLEELAAGVTALEALPIDEAFPSGTTSAWFADSLPAKEIAGNADFDSGAIQLGTLGVNHRRGTLPLFFAAGGRLAEAQTIAESFLAQATHVPQAGELVLSATGHAYQGLAIAHACLAVPTRPARHSPRPARSTPRSTIMRSSPSPCLPSSKTSFCPTYRPTYPSADDLPQRRRKRCREPGVRCRPIFPRAAPGWACSSSRGDGRKPARLPPTPRPTATTTYVARCIASSPNWRATRMNPELVRAHVGSLLPEGPTTEPGGCVFADGLFCQRLAADLELDHGNLAAALDWLTANDRWLAWNGSVFGRACNRNCLDPLLSGIGRYCARSRLCAEALRAASQPDQPLARITAHRLIGELAGARPAGGS